LSYLLDTDIVSNTIKKQPSAALLDRLAAVPRAEQFTSVITLGEMWYGALCSPNAERIRNRIETDVLPRLNVVDFDVDAAAAYANARFELESRGTPVAEADLRIAAIALARGFTLVTGNIRHFARVPGLRVENWL